MHITTKQLTNAFCIQSPRLQSFFAAYAEALLVQAQSRHQSLQLAVLPFPPVEALQFTGA